MQTYRQITGIFMAGICLATCTHSERDTFPYPPTVITANKKQHYKTALWYVYTSCLDSSVFRKQPLGDSLQTTLKQLLIVKRLLKSIEQNSGTTCFRFDFDDSSPLAMELLVNCYTYGPKPFGLRPVVAVWINNQDGLIDSVLDIHNHRFGYTYRLDMNKRLVPVSRRESLYNINQPCKLAFLQRNSRMLNSDLRRLCLERGIIQ